MATAEMLTALRRCRERQPLARGVTPFDVVLEEEPFSLRRYHRPGKLPGGLPLLIVYSTINRPDLLDLTENRSMIRSLLQAGLDVHVLDWGYPLDADSQLDLEDYVDGFLHDCVGHVRGLQSGSGARAINALGVCQGGTLLTCYASKYPERIRRLINLAAPLDFHVNGGVLHQLASTLATTNALPGNIEGKGLSASFAALRPLDLFIRRYQALPAITQHTEALDEFLRMEAWMYDCPDQPGVMFRRFIHSFYQDNALARGTLELGGRPVELDNIQAEVLCIRAEHDHLVPPAATQALACLLPASRYREISCPGGHLSLFVGGHSRKSVVPAIIAWCKDGVVKEPTFIGDTTT